jgi:phospholipid-binding lipoprotein MlaA
MTPFGIRQNPSNASVSRTLWRRVALVLGFVGVFSSSLSWGIDPLSEVENPDPYEDINRAIFAFNDRLDQMVLSPVARGYRRVTPDVAERGIGNVFSNLSEFNSAVNSILQGKVDAALASAGRFAVNTTLGIAGLFDVASEMGLESRETDFGETLAVWGVPRGPYLMVPFLGPRTLRSGVGNVADIYLSPEAYIESVSGRNALYALRVVDERAALLDADALLSGDRYVFLRDAYLQRRAARVDGESTVGEFSDFGDDWEQGEWGDDPL